MSLVPPDPAVGQMVGEDKPSVCTREHCFYAFDALYCALTSSEPISPNFPDEKYPLFVTWNTRSSRRAPRLRGCIGTFEAQPLHEGVAEYALISAFKDHRFRRIEEKELPTLECGISLLTDFEDASSYLDWTIGVHGISISFPHPSLIPASTPSTEPSSPFSSSPSLPRYSSKQSFSATYLPDVMPQQGWDRIEAVDSAIHKAGWDGRITEDLRRSIKLRRYQSSKCTVGWDEYVTWRLEQGSKI
ncbi:alport syndrome [Heliocybe sulcata]|uniref:Alport syndrome n=1 Tax=Heliocybe sulcata TaxID=5364 RepID=A0A5C3NFM8_9AGAM|nr:alport syndrome [Heliocybe sulcata]